jgi:hypothetical protein
MDASHPTGSFLHRAELRTGRRVPGGRDANAEERTPVMRDGVRPSTPADAPAIVELLLEAGLRPNREPRELHWKYWQERADWPGSRSFVLTKGGEILAHAAIIPGTLVQGARRVRIIHMIDWAARRTAPVAGVSLMKYVGRLTDVLLAVGGSMQTLQILPHIGFRPCGTVTGYVRALHPLRILRRGSNPSWRLPLRLARSAFWALTAPSDDGKDWQARRLLRNETGRVACVLPTRMGDAGVLERSEELFAYILTCPIMPMELYALENNGDMRGYFLLALAPGQVRIADCWVDSEDPADWRALIQCAVGRAKQNRDAAELVIWASDPVLSRGLEECGFHPRKVHTVQLLTARDFTIPAATFRVQMLDSDAAFHHPGHAVLWA